MTQLKKETYSIDAILSTLLRLLQIQYQNSLTSLLMSLPLSQTVIFFLPENIFYGACSDTQTDLFQFF